MTNAEVIAHQKRVYKITEAILALDQRTTGDDCVDYKALYSALFNDLTDEIEQRSEYCPLSSLISMQQRSEERFLM